MALDKFEVNLVKYEHYSRTLLWNVYTLDGFRVFLTRPVNER